MHPSPEPKLPADAGYTTDEKLQWEVKKLQAETLNLSRPFVRQPTFWVGIGTIVLSLGTNFCQYSDAERKSQLAQIKAEQLTLDATKLEGQKMALESAIGNLRVNLKKIQEPPIAANGQAIQPGVRELQQKAATLDNIAEAAEASLAKTTISWSIRTHDLDKAAGLELQAYQALLAGDFHAAQLDFQASEDAANGFRYSYEWSRLLRLHASSTPDERKAVLREALEKGYAKYSPADIQQRLRQMAQ